MKAAKALVQALPKEENLYLARYPKKKNSASPDTTTSCLSSTT